MDKTIITVQMTMASSTSRQARVERAISAVTAKAFCIQFVEADRLYLMCNAKGVGLQTIHKWTQATQRGLDA